MRKLSLLLLSLFLVQACTPKVNLPEGAPPYLKTKDLIEKAKAKSLSFKSLKLSGKGRYQTESSRQSFRFEIRMAKDSLIWIDLADPILGLKVARAVLTAEEGAYFNRLDRTFSRGSSAELAQKVGFQFDFKPLMAVLSASFLDGDFEWYQDYQVSYYGLSNLPQTPDQVPPPPGEPQLFQTFDAEYFRPLSYRIARPQFGQNLLIELKEYQDFESTRFPSKIHLEYIEKSEMVLDLELTSVSVDEKLSYPFRIPNGYEPI